MPALPAPSMPGIAVAAAVGLAVGVLGYTFVYAKGSAYLGDDPRACAQCHVMQPYLDSWQASPHHGVATCNDCHTPANPLRRYLVKASNGFHHSSAFTAGNYPTQLRARESSRRVVEEQCRRCHARVVAEMVGDDGTASCVRCHRTVGHL